MGKVCEGGGDMVLRRRWYGTKISISWAPVGAKNLLGPLRMCCCDVVLNGYSIAVLQCCSFSFPFCSPSVLQSISMNPAVLWFCSVMSLLCCETQKCDRQTELLLEVLADLKIKGWLFLDCGNIRITAYELYKVKNIFYRWIPCSYLSVISKNWHRKMIFNFRHRTDVLKLYSREILFLDNIIQIIFKIQRFFGVVKNMVKTKVSITDILNGWIISVFWWS